MAYTRRGSRGFADEQSDLPEALRAYADGYPPTRFADAACECGSHQFLFAVDDDEGAAERECVRCERAAFIADSADLADSANLAQCECTCGADVFELTLGLATYEDDADAVRWIYVGARCVACGEAGCYSDWKCDGSESAAVLLQRA